MTTNNVSTMCLASCSPAPTPVPPRGPRATNAGNATHIAAALRVGVNLFVTRDGPVLAKAGALAAAFNGFRVLTPEDALAFVHRMKHRYDVRHRQAD